MNDTIDNERMIIIDGNYSSTQIIPYILDAFQEYRDDNFDGSINIEILNNNKLSSFPKLLFQTTRRGTQNFLGNVKEIIFKNVRKLKKIDNINSFINLEKLLLENFHNGFKLSNSFYDLVKLKYLKINNIGNTNNIIEIVLTDQIINFTQIEEIYFNRIIINGCEKMSGLTSLKSLYLINTRNIRFEDESSFFTGLTNLEKLLIRLDFGEFTHSSVLSDTQFKNIFNLEKITSLHLIGSVPSSYPNFINLEIPDNSLPNLKELEISHMKLGEDYSTRLGIFLEKSINKLTNLESLKINKCNLELFPNIKDCINLKDLNLESNFLEEIPETIGNLIDLENLNLNNNNLKNLPLNISQLDKLKTISYNNNSVLIGVLNNLTNNNIPENTREFLNLFLPGCSLRSLLNRAQLSSLNSNEKLRSISVLTIDISNPVELVDIQVSDYLLLRLKSKEETNFFEQTINFINEHDSELVNQLYLIQNNDLIRLGMFQIRIEGELGIDVGGLYRQYLTDLNNEFNEQDFFLIEEREVENKGQITTALDIETIKSIMSVLILLYNTGEGNFKSNFTFGHSITIYNKIFPHKNIMESKCNSTTLEEIVKQFAIYTLDEPKDKVNNLNKNHPRLITYLWLMVEFIEEDLSLENMVDNSMCFKVKNKDEGYYDFIFDGVEFPEVEEPVLSNRNNSGNQNNAGNRNNGAGNQNNAGGNQNNAGNRNNGAGNQNNAGGNRNNGAGNQNNAGGNQNNATGAIEWQMWANSLGVRAGNQNNAAGNQNNDGNINASNILPNPPNQNNAVNRNAANILPNPPNQNNAEENQNNADENQNNADENQNNAEGNQHLITEEEANNDLSGEDEFPEVVERYSRRTDQWRNNPTSVRNFSRNIGLAREARTRNDQSITNLPYLNRHVTNMYGDGWRSNPTQRSTFRRLATQERAARINNEQLATDNPEILSGIEQRLRNREGDDIGWRNNITARRELRRMTGGSSNNSNNLWHDNPISQHLVQQEIIDAFTYFIDRHINDNTQFINNSKRTLRKDINIFMINSIFNPSKELDIEKLIKNLSFADQFNEEQKEVFKDTLRDFKSNLTPNQLTQINTDINQILPEDDPKTLDELFPNQEEFIRKFLEQWTGSRNISNQKYSIHYRRNLDLIEIHTCFYQIVLNFDNKRELVTKIIKTILMVGSSFGVAGRKTMKKNKKGTSKTMKNKKHAKKNKSMGTKPFGKGTKPFGKGTKPFGKGTNLFGKGTKPFGKGTKPFGKGTNLFGKGTKPFGKGNNLFGKGNNLFGKGNNLFGKGTKHKGKGTKHKGKGTKHKGNGTKHKGKGTKHKGKGTNTRKNIFKISSKKN